jgi:hypothetical protein
MYQSCPCSVFSSALRNVATCYISVLLLIQYHLTKRRHLLCISPADAQNSVPPYETSPSPMYQSCPCSVLSSNLRNVATCCFFLLIQYRLTKRRHLLYMSPAPAQYSVAPYETSPRAVSVLLLIQYHLTKRRHLLYISPAPVHYTL